MNTDFKAYSLDKIYSIIRYCKEFMRDSSLLDLAELRGLISQAIEETLPELLESPELIPNEISKDLLFELPITKCSKTRAVVIYLYALFKFNTLSNSYFKVLPLLPDRLEDLNLSLQDLFSISNHKELQNLLYYK